jgi:hypothetical protein
MDVAPAFEDYTLRVGADEEELFEVLVALGGDVGRARDMRFAGIAELELGTLFLAIGAVNEKHLDDP